MVQRSPALGDKLLLHTYLGNDSCFFISQWLSTMPRGGKAQGMTRRTVLSKRGPEPGYDDILLPN